MPVHRHVRLYFQDCPFVVRGPTYLKDRKKIPAGMAAFTLGSVDMVSVKGPVEHVARFLPSIRSAMPDQLFHLKALYHHILVLFHLLTAWYLMGMYL